MQLESTTFLGSDKFGVINVAITIPVVHLQNGIDHLRELNVGEDFRGTRRRGIGAQVLALLNYKANKNDAWLVLLHSNKRAKKTHHASESAT